LHRAGSAQPFLGSKVINFDFCSEWHNGLFGSKKEFPVKLPNGKAASWFNHDQIAIITSRVPMPLKKTIEFAKTTELPFPPGFESSNFL
jgi:hypothetical protein